MRVAYIHDWLITYAGAEKVLEGMLEVIPADRIFTLFYKPENFENTEISKFKITPSFLNNLPSVHKYYRNLLPIMPLAVEGFNLKEYDVVISSNHAVAKGVIVMPYQVHISYFHTPIRYAWDLTFDYLSTLPQPLKLLAHTFLNYIRMWDYVSSLRVDVFIANSKTVAKRIKRFYGKDSEVIYPPVDVDKFSVSENHEGYFITVSRLVPYKNVPLIVQAFNSLGLPLMVVGDGPDMYKIKKIARKNIHIMGHVDTPTLSNLLSKARGFVFAAYEDFGISVVEAMASGVPVIAYGRGGASETVINGKTGIFFYEQKVECIEEAIKRFLKVEDKFDRKLIRKHSFKFGKKRFKDEFKRLVVKVLDERGIQP